MLITLDGKRLPDQDASGLTLQALIDQVRAGFLSDRIVVGVRVDGQPLNGEHLGQRLGETLPGVSQLDLESADPIDLAAAALRELTDQLGDARDGLSQIAAQIQAGKPDAALDDFRGFLGVWRNSQTALRECSQLLGRDLTRDEVGGQMLLDHIEQLSGKLRELRDAFEARDMVLLSDLVEYEMPELCQAWQGHFQVLADGLVSRQVMQASHR